MTDLITFTHQVAMSLHRVGLAGAGVDVKTYHDLGQQWAQDSKRLHDQLMKFALRHGMKQFAATNDTDIRRVLYKKLELPILSKTRKDGLPAVAKPILERFLKDETVSKEAKGFINDLIAFNSADKLLSTWFGKEDKKSTSKKSIGELLQPVPKRDDLKLLHFWVFPLRARTGRRASGGGEEGDPEGRNAQNWHPKAKKMIRSRWNKSKIAVADFSKLEMVVMGWRAKDEKLLDYFTKGEGYIGVAKEFWGQDVEDGTKMYKATKSFVLGIGYGMGDFLLAESLWYKTGFKFSEDWGKHLKETSKARKRYLRMFDGLRRYIKSRHREVADTQQVVSPSGRVRHLPHHGEPGFTDGKKARGHWKHILNSAINYPIQSFASDITGSAIVDYENALLKEHRLSYKDWHLALLEHPHDLPCSPVFNEVHDELDLDLHPRSGKRDLEILQSCMANVRTLKKLVPDFNLTLKVDVQIVPTWGDAT